MDCLYLFFVYYVVWPLKIDVKVDSSENENIEVLTLSAC